MMKVKVLGVGLGLVVLPCAVVVAFAALLFPSDAPARQAPEGSAAGPRSTAAGPTPSAHVEPARQIAEPEAQELQAASASASAAAPASAPVAPLPPEQENARLRKILDESGGSAGDALDRTSRDIANDLVTRLRSQDAQVNLQAVECRAAGCSATFEVAADADYFRLHHVFDGIDPKSPIARWPGSRIMPPAVHRDGKLIVAILLIRPDSRARF